MVQAVEDRPHFFRLPEAQGVLDNDHHVVFGSIVAQRQEPIAECVAGRRSAVTAHDLRVENLHEPAPQTARGIDVGSKFAGRRPIRPAANRSSRWNSPGRQFHARRFERAAEFLRVLRNGLEAVSTDSLMKAANLDTVVPVLAGARAAMV